MALIFEDNVCCLAIPALLTPVDSLKQRDWVPGGIFQAPRGVERVSDELACFLILNLLWWQKFIAPDIRSAQFSTGCCSITSTAS